MVEHAHGKRKVPGSIPGLGSTEYRQTGKILTTMAKTKARSAITLDCSICKERNYHTQKNKTKTTTRLELNKFCKHCRKVTAHKEGK